MQQAQKATHAAAEASAAAVAAEASAVEAATAAVVAAVAEEAASRLSSPRRPDHQAEARKAVAAAAAADTAFETLATGHAAQASNPAAVDGPVRAAGEEEAQQPVLSEQQSAHIETKPPSNTAAAAAAAGDSPLQPAASKPASTNGQPLACSPGGCDTPAVEFTRAHTSNWTQSTGGGVNESSAGPAAATATILVKPAAAAPAAAPAATTSAAAAPAAASEGGKAAAPSTGGSSTTAGNAASSTSKESTAKQVTKSGASCKSPKAQPAATAAATRSSSNNGTHTAATSGTSSSSPRKALLLPSTTSSSISSAGGARSAKSYAAMSAAKLGLKFPSSSVGGAKAAASRAGGSAAGQTHASTVGGASAVRSASVAGAVGKFPRVAGSSSSKGAVGRAGSAAGLTGSIAAGAGPVSSSSSMQAALQSCPGSIAIEMLKEAAERARSSTISSSSGGIGSKLRAGSSTVPLDLDRESSQTEAFTKLLVGSASTTSCGTGGADQEIPAQTAGAAPAAAAGEWGQLPIEERLLMKQQQLMQMVGLLRSVRSRSTSPKGRAGSRNASPRRSNSPGPVPPGAVSATRAAYVGIPSITRNAASPTNGRSQPASPRQRAASPEALAQLAVPAYRKQQGSRTVSPEPSAVISELQSAAVRAMRARSPERMARPSQALGAKTGGNATRSASPPKQNDKAPSRKTTPLPRVAQLLHAADAATSASAAVRAATPPKRDTTPQRSAAVEAAAGSKTLKTTTRKHGGPVTVPAAAAATMAAGTAVSPSLPKASSRSTSPLRYAGVTRPGAAAQTAAAAAAMAAAAVSPPPYKSPRLSRSPYAAKADSKQGPKATVDAEKAAKVVRTLVALDDLLPGLGPEFSTSAAGGSRRSVNELRTAAETLLKNLQAGTQVPNDALETILLGAQSLAQRGGSSAISPRPAAAAANAAATAAGSPAGGNNLTSTTPAVTAASALAAVTGKDSSAKLHALAQQLAALCQDMGAGRQGISSSSGASSGTTPGSQGGKGSVAAAAAAKAAATAAVAAAAAMDAANKQTQRNQQQQRLKAAAAGIQSYTAAAQPKPHSLAAVAAAGAAAQTRLPACQTPPAAGSLHTPLVIPLVPVLTSPFGQAAVQGYSNSNGSSGISTAAVSKSSSGTGAFTAMQALLPDPSKAAAAAAAALEAASSAAAATLARQGLRLGGAIRPPGTPRRRQPIAQKLLRMIASGRKGIVSKCHRLPSVAGSSSGGGCASPRVLTASAAASLPKSPLGLTAVTARQAHNVLKPKGLVSKHSSFRLLTPWIKSRPAAGVTALKQSPALFYTQAFRASAGGPDSGSARGRAGQSAPGLARTASDAAKQLQQKVVEGSEALRKLLRTSSSMSRLSLFSNISYARTGEGNAEAADEETAGTAAPAISAADLHHAHHILTASDAAGSGQQQQQQQQQLGTVLEGDREAESSAGSVARAESPTGGKGPAVTLERAHSRERLTAGKVPKGPPMMSRSAYLQVRV